MSDSPLPSQQPTGRALGCEVVLVVFFVLMFVGIGLWRMSSAKPHSPAPAEIRAVLDEQAAAWNRGDLEGFMAGYWHSDELTFCSGGDVTKGWQATYDRYRKRYQAEGREMGRLEFSDVSVEVASPELALVRGRWKLTLSNDTPYGLYTLQVKRFADGWKVVYDHTSAAEKKAP